MFDAIGKVLQQVGSEINAAELQGIFCGLQCLNVKNDNPVWQSYVFPEFDLNHVPTARAHKVLLQLQTYTQEQLASDDFSFTLLLPNDEQPLQQRLAGLSAWADGFLMGLGLGGLKDERSVADLFQEFIRDLTTIARGLSINDGTETDYMQVSEYVKMGVLSFFNEQNEQSEK